MALNSTIQMQFSPYAKYQKPFSEPLMPDHCRAVVRLIMCFRVVNFFQKGDCRIYCISINVKLGDPKCAFWRILKKCPNTGELPSITLVHTVHQFKSGGTTRLHDSAAIAFQPLCDVMAQGLLLKLDRQNCCVAKFSWSRFRDKDSLTKLNQRYETVG